MNNKIVIVITVLAALTSAGVSAQELSLDDCIETGIKNNLMLKSKEFDIQIDQESTRQLIGSYEPSISAGFSKTDSKSSGVNPVFGSESKVDSLNIGAKKRFKQTGGILSVDLNSDRTDSDSAFLTLNPSHESDITISYVQPMLKNFLGRNEKQTYKLRKISENISGLLYKIEKNNLSNNIEKAYLSLNYAKKNLDSQRSSLERAKELLVINKRKLKDGLLEEVDVIATEAAITIREAAILQSENTLMDTKDNLKRLIGINPSNGVDFKYDFPEMFEHRDILTDEAINKALSSRPDLKAHEETMRINVSKRRINSRGTLPSLDLTTRYGLTNTAEAVGDNIDAIFSRDNPTWYIGLNLNLFPLNRVNKSILRQTDYEILKLKAEYEDSKTTVVNQCRSITRRLNTQAKYVGATFRAMELQRRKLKLEEVKFNQGRSAIRWILSYHDDLSNAETEYYKAMTDYYLALSDMSLITGGKK